jgi:hypothetical protein
MFFLFYFLILGQIKQSNSLLNTRSNEFLGNTSKHLFYFVHVIINSLVIYFLIRFLFSIKVTDIHITHFDNIDRIEQFEQFCNEIIKTLIQPQVTIVSGNCE